jgi:7,8-dihydroneopterin aldolase/epimerase/oxygenase
MDRISIKELRVPTRIGVTEEERAQAQTVAISIDMWADLSGSGRSDLLTDTIDYHAVTLEVAEMVRSSETNLLEHLAAKIIALIGGMDGVRGVTVEVTKESPPIPEDVQAVSVTLERPTR